MSQSHILVPVMLIGAAQTGVSDLDENLVWLDLAGGGGFDNLALF